MTLLLTLDFEIYCSQFPKLPGYVQYPFPSQSFLPMLLSEVEEPDSSFFSRITLKVFASIEKYKEKKGRIKLNQLSQCIKFKKNSKESRLLNLLTQRISYEQDDVVKVCCPADVDHCKLFATIKCSSDRLMFLSLRNVYKLFRADIRQRNLNRLALKISRNPTVSRTSILQFQIIKNPGYFFGKRRNQVNMRHILLELCV